MPGIFDFIKKQPAPASGANNSQAQAVRGSQTQAVVTSQQSYNGIGTPPGGQASYNGIGTPVATVVVETTQQPAQPIQPLQTPTPPSSTGSEAVTPDPISNTVSGNAAAVSSGSGVSDTSTTDAPGSVPGTAQGAATDGVSSDATPADAASTEDANNSTTAPADKNANSDSGTTDTTSGEKKEEKDDVASKKADSRADTDTKADEKKRLDMDVMTHLTQRSNRVFLSANNKAKELNSAEVDSEHLLHGLLADPEIYKLLTSMKIMPQAVDQELDKIYKKGETPVPAPQTAPRVKHILDNSLVIARKMGYEFISPEHLLLATYEEGEGVAAQTLKKLGVNKEELNKKILGKKEGLDEKSGDGKVQKSAIAQFTIDLTAKAESGQLDPCVGRSDVIERVIHIMSRRLKNNPVLTGEPGVGKTAIVEGLAQAIVAKKVPEQLLGKRIMQLDLMSVVAGASHRGEFEQRMKSLVDEVKEGKGQIILFIDEIHTIVGAGGGGEGSLDASNFIKPALSRGELQMIGATTITEYKRIEKDAALERRFQSVLVPEPTEEQAIKMLKALRNKFEAFHKVKIPDEAIENAVKLSKRYLSDRFLPDKAVDLMDEAASAVRLPLMSLPEEIQSGTERIAQLKQEHEEAEKRGDRVKARIIKSKIADLEDQLKAKKDEYDMKKAQTTTVVTTDIIRDVISKRTGIPVSKITSSEGDKIQHLEDIMHERLIGQERAVKTVAQAVRRGRAGLKAANRPIGSFIFLGPSGVGKTELAKTLAEILFGQEESMIRFDMTEYMEKHEVAKLLGPPPGYVGYEEGGKLTEAVRLRQYSVVLFDEVEKAHPDIFNILLQILDDGRLTDNKGRTISFKNTVVICTSNIGTKLIQEELLKQNKGQVEEPPVVSTYAFSPRGREILTIGNKYFERDPNTKLSDSGKPSADSKKVTEQKPDDAKADIGAKDAKAETNPETAKPGDARAGEAAKEMKKPDTEGSDFAKNGVKDSAEKTKTETKSESKKADEVKAEAGTSNWIEGLLFDYFAGQKLERAKPVQNDAEDVEGEVPSAPAAPVVLVDDKDLQFPVLGYDTHAISSKGVEMISRDSLLYFRNSTTSKIWSVTNLIDYMKDNIVINALPDAPDEQLPTARLKTHAFSPDEKEIVTFRDRFWRRTEGATDWETGYLKDYFLDQTLPEGNFPVTHWDIHTFSPSGQEVIVVGETIWTRPTNSNQWKQQSLHDYFGADFPLEKEIEEKNRIESESEAKKYDVIKSRVLNELLKFFRPELVNRFDEVIVFEPLKFAHMIAIVKLQLKALSRMLEEQELGFSYTDAAVKEIVRSGFDPVFGARPLRRAIQRLLENPISELIIAQTVKPGDFIYVDWDGEKFVFDVERTEVIANGSTTPKNFTPLEIRPFVEKYYSSDKDAILKNLEEQFPDLLDEQEALANDRALEEAKKGFSAEKKESETPQEDRKAEETTLLSSEQVQTEPASPENSPEQQSAPAEQTDTPSRNVMPPASVSQKGAAGLNGAHPDGPAALDSQTGKPAGPV
ncbi:MAG: AAA family ATPase [Patescibacteria group bacterium]|nr:AAA family ATPase [Patescibacteria group bacterium]